MSSYGHGKDKVCGWVLANFPAGTEILDVGACVKLEGYRQGFAADIRDFEYDWYDLIIFGDVIEHMTVEQAQAVLAYAWPRCRDMIVAVPWLYKQDAIYGNPYERHIQDDLTPELFAQRYPGFEVLCDPGHDYCYYHKGGQA